MTEATKPATPPAKDSGAADAAAKREGFASASTKAQAEKSAAAKPRRQRPAPDRKSVNIIAAIKEKAADTVEAAVTKEAGDLSVQLGTDRGPIKAIAPVPVTLELSGTRRGGKWQVSSNVVHDTHGLPRTTQVTHVWLFQGNKPIDVVELGAPTALSPGNQLQFRVGQLAFG